MKTAFEVLNYNFEVIMNLSLGPVDFCKVWSDYLATCGWSEAEYEMEMEKQIFSEVGTN